MDAQKVDIYMMTAGKNLPAECVPAVREKLLAMDDNKFLVVQSTEMKSPMVAFWLNFFLGGFGAEYFYLGKTGLGIVKLITCGGLGFWSLINLFTIMGSTKKVNYENLLMLI